MDWNDLFGKAIELVKDHWLKAVVALALTMLSGAWTFFWAWRKWRSRYDMDVLHISQNSIEMRPTGKDGASEPWLILDVHSENQLSDDITHPIPRRLIKQAASRTTESQPFLKFSDADRWHVLNIVRLAIAEPFKIGTAAKMLPDAKVGVVDAVFAMTYERYTNMRQGKIRVMIAPKKLLDDPNAFKREFRFSSPQHIDRVTTLKKMQEDYLKGEKSEFCMDVRLNILL